MGLKLHPTGTCFNDALDYLELVVKETPRHAWPDYKLAHGILLAPDGGPYSHAWVEQRDAHVWHCGILNGVRGYGRIDRDEYYEEMCVQEVTRYTIEQAWQQNHISGHYGPWVERYRRLCKDLQAAEASR
jgi:hypothetical protein